MPAARPIYVGNDPDPVYRHSEARMFDSDFLEAFTRVHPAVPGVLFVPVTLYFAWQGVWQVHSVLWTLLFTFGLYFWTLTEYSLHRWVFHIPVRGPITRWMNFTFHGVHHQYPDDKRRLVMVPTVSVPLAFLFYELFELMLPHLWVAPAFAGFVLGYLFYDYSHWASHYIRPPKQPWLKPIAGMMRTQRTRHMRHHFLDPELGHGVSNGLWDGVFGTDNL